MDSTQVYQENAYQYIQIASIVLLVYDHFITLDNEVKYIWSKASRRISIAFLFLRYVGLVVMLVVYGILCFFNVIGQPEISPGGTTIGAIIADVLMMLVVFYIELLFLWRIYALYEKNLRLVLGLLFFGIMIMSIAVIMLLRAKMPGISQMQRNIYHSASWMGLFTWDVLMCALTIVRTYQTRLAYHLPSRRSMVSIIFRDGIFYFLILTAVSLCNLFTDYLAPHALRGCFSVFNICIAINLFCRMMINLIEGFDQSEEFVSLHNKLPQAGATIAIKRLPISEIESEISTFQASEDAV